jgi:ABC-type phosphate transport system substrate-binding protein
MRNWSLAVILGMVTLLSPIPSSAGGPAETIVVIANKAVNLSKISRDELRPIFQTKKDTWPDGTPVRVFNLPESSSVRQAFDGAVLGLDPDRAARYWVDRRIRGGERPPQTAPSASAMIKVVSNTAGGLGYVDAAALDATVKVVARIVNGQVVAP